MITLIAAAGQNNELGKDNDLVWHLPDDFKRFKKLTTGHHIIMGRKTFESFPKPLPNRTHIIITRNKDYQTEGAFVVHSLDAALLKAVSDDTYFPEIDATQWELISEEHHGKDERHAYAFTYETWVRK